MMVERDYHYKGDKVIDYYVDALDGIDNDGVDSLIAAANAGEPDVAVSIGILHAYRKHLDVPLDILEETLAVLAPEDDDGEDMGTSECREMIAAKRKQLAAV